MSEHSLEESREKFPKAALELDLVSGRVDPETGEKVEDFKSDEMQDWLEKCVLEVLDLIASQGHSGFTHGYLLSLLIPLLKDKPITPLTGKEWEWENSYGLTQNKRCPGVFKESDGSAYFIHGRAFSVNGGKRAFSVNGGKTYWTSKESRKTITFPCDAKQLETEYIIKENK